MPSKYIAHRRTWLSHESRYVEPGERFETTFPAGMRLGDNLELIEEKAPEKAGRRGRAEGATEDQG